MFIQPQICATSWVKRPCQSQESNLMRSVLLALARSSSKLAFHGSRSFQLFSPNPPVESSFLRPIRMVFHGFSMGFPWVFLAKNLGELGLSQEIAPLWESTETRCGFETQVSGGFFGVISRLTHW